MDRQLLCQKVRQRISVMKTFLLSSRQKGELKCHFSAITEIFDELFDVIIDDPFLTL